MDIPRSIPPQFHKKYEEAASMIIPFCLEYLDKEYEELCIRALQKLCRKRTEPMACGRSNTWAAGIVFAITQANGVTGNSAIRIACDRRYHLDSAGISGAFGVSKGGMTEKAKSVKAELKITPENEEWIVEFSRNSVHAMKMMRSMLSKRR